MPSNHGFKPLRRVLQVLQHSEFDISVSNHIGVSFILFLSFDGALFVLESRLVEVHLLRHDDGLN